MFFNSIERRNKVGINQIEFRFVKNGEILHSANCRIQFEKKLFPCRRDNVIKKN